MAVTKTPCPVSRKQFLDNAKPLNVQINGVPHAAMVKEFSTGGFGYYMGDKITLMIDNIPVRFQVSLSIVAVNSKDAPK